MVSFGAFWVGGTLCDLLTHLLYFKRNRGNVQVNVRKDQRMRLSFLPEQLVRSSQQLVLKDTKKGFYWALRCAMNVIELAVRSAFEKTIYT